MNSWNELKVRLDIDKTIDKDLQKKISKEKQRWRKVLKRIIAAIKLLSKKMLSFRGCKENPFQDSNGNFLGVVEIMNEFDLVV